MKTNHTPGQWSFFAGNGDYVIEAIEAKTDNNSIADVYAPKGAPRSEAIANARLMTSSPHLLKALQFDNCFPITTTKEHDETIEFALSLGWKRDMPLEIFARQYRINAIKKATE